MDIRMICMDLDGTALQRDHSSFSPRLLEALAEVHRRGIRIVPVTGRQGGLLPPVLQQGQLWLEYAILCNGGQIRNFRTGELLYRLDIDPKALEQLLELTDRYNLPIEFSLDSILHLTRNSYDLQLPWPNLNFHRDTILARYGRILPSLVPLCGPGVEKINLLCVPPELHDAVEEGLASIAVSGVWASRSSMEITHPEATKGNGLQKLCSLLDIPLSRVMAIGDSGNDVTMLRAAGFGVAMGNAPDFVRAEADAITERYDSDGAAIAIERYVLNL